MKPLDEQIVEYYNSLVKAGSIPNVTSPVDLEWMKRQRILEGRKFLNIRFGSLTVDSILGEETYLAKANSVILQIYSNSDYQLLPQLANLLALECSTMLEEDNLIYQKYASLNSEIAIPIFELSKRKLPTFTTFSTIWKLPTKQLEEIHGHITSEVFQQDRYLFYFCEYVQKTALHVLEEAFEEIKKEVENKTK